MGQISVEIYERAGSVLSGNQHPEVWKPPGAGTVVATGQLAGGITATFNIASADPMAAAREIERVLGRLLWRSSQLAIDDRGVT